MTRIQLRHEIEDAVRFWGIEEEGALVGVMGIQDKGDVCLIRHAYVKTNRRNKGIGTRLLRHLESMTEKSMLIGTWADATWAIQFYQKNGYRLLNEAEKNDLLRKFWSIPERQVETSVVLADGNWSGINAKACLRSGTSASSATGEIGLDIRAEKDGESRYEDIMDKVIIEKLPNTKEIRGAKRWEEERGEFVQIAYQEAMQHLVVFEIRRGFSRGDHYHEKKEEVFYVFEGKIKASFIDMDTLQKEERILEKGEKIRVKPRCGHLFYGLEDTIVIEYSPQVYDKEDTNKIELT